jgi:hypothetical protein
LLVFLFVSEKKNNEVASIAVSAWHNCYYIKMTNFHTNFLVQLFSDIRLMMNEKNYQKRSNKNLHD